MGSCTTHTDRERHRQRESEGGRESERAKEGERDRRSTIPYEDAACTSIENNTLLQFATMNKTLPKRGSEKTSGREREVRRTHTATLGTCGVHFRGPIADKICDVM